MNCASSIKGLAAALALLLVLPLAPWASAVGADADDCGSCCATAAVGCCCTPVEAASESQGCGCSLSAVPTDQSQQPLAPTSVRVDLPVHALSPAPFAFTVADVHADLLPTGRLGSLHNHSPPLFLLLCTFRC